MESDYRSTLEDYKRKGFADRSGYGTRPALLVVDFINGFTDPASPLGGDYSSQLRVTQELLERFRRAGLPVVYTTIAYEPDYRDAGLFIKKIPSLGILLKGSRASQVDERIQPRRGEPVLEKKFASAFFGTELDFYLKGRGVDTVIMTGCTTSGCIRASAIDSLQYGFHTVVVRDGVGDRAQGPHEANLFDIDAKYGDVVSHQDVLVYLQGLAAATGMSGQASEDFQRWWNQKPWRD
jgi:nicotinamidase-related amidase